MKLIRIRALLAISIMLGSLASAAGPVKPYNRSDATNIIADLRRIVTPLGIERTEKVCIGCIDQWVSIRSRDRRNPVLLLLHGGPGFVSMPINWYLGRHDFNVNADVAAEWLGKVEAPDKRLVMFEHSGHEMMIEEPGKMLFSLVADVRPIAAATGDVAPK